MEGEKSKEVEEQKNKNAEEQKSTLKDGRIGDMDKYNKDAQGNKGALAEALLFITWAVGVNILSSLWRTTPKDRKSIIE